MRWAPHLWGSDFLLPPEVPGFVYQTSMPAPQTDESASIYDYTSPDFGLIQAKPTKFPYKYTDEPRL